MADLTAQRLPALRQHRLPGLDLGSEFVYPAYGGQSILNVPSSVCKLLGVPPLGAPPLDEALLAPLGAPPGGEDLRRVILVVMDALALHRLQRWLNEGRLPAWRRLVESGLLAPLTSITPSTTSAALTALWTGRSAAEHGITGYEMWFKEYGIVANTILHTPMSFRKHGIGTLNAAGFDPEKYLLYPTLGAHLAAHGVSSHAFQHYNLSFSGLSEMYFKDVERHPFATTTDLFINLRQFLETPPKSKQYVYVYWSEVDSFSHRYGPEDERVAAEMESFSLAMERLLFERLSPAARAGTALLLIADHGQIVTRLDPHYELRNHPNLTRRLHLQPTGENRFTYLHVRPGQMEAVRETLERTWPNQFLTLDPPYAVEAGLFGPGQPHPGLLDRLGDLVVVSRDDAYLWWANEDNPLTGRHGGLHPDEMLVPFLASRL